MECRIAIVHEIARCVVPRKGFAELLCGPRGRRVVGHRDVPNASTLMGEDQEHEQESTRCVGTMKKSAAANLLSVIRFKLSRI